MLILGDCFEYFNKIESESINLILTDPPFNISKKSNFHKVSTTTPEALKTKYANHSIDFGYWDKEIDLDTLFKEFSRILVSGGTLIMFFDIWKCNLVKDLATKYNFKQPRIGQWIKTNPVPVNSKTNYLSNASEYFFSFVKGKNPVFNSKYDPGIYRYPLCHGIERLNHPTQKPLQLISDLVIKHSNINDVILDPFSGTSTLAAACIENKRNWICIEKDRDYYELSHIRIQKIQQNSKTKI